MKGDRTEPGPVAVSVRNLKKTYGNGSDGTTALSGVSFDIEPGTVVGVLGPNGAGKTTLIKSILDLVTPTTGERTIFGVDVGERPEAAYEHVGAMFEGARNVYWRLTVRQNLDFFAKLQGNDPAARADRFDELLEQLNLEKARDTRVKELSRGQKQKVALATTLSGDKNLVFLDEPTLGLDVESSLELRRELRRLADQTDLTVVLSSHDMDTIEDVCDRAIIMHDGGVLVDDSIENLLDFFDTDVYELSLGAPVPEAVEQALRQNFDIVSWSGGSDDPALEVALTDPNRIHDLTGTVLDAGIPLERLDAVDPDFEDVFLRLTDANEHYSPMATGRGPLHEESSEAFENA